MLEKKIMYNFLSEAKCRLVDKWMKHDSEKNSILYEVWWQRRMKEKKTMYDELQTQHL